MLLFHQEVDHVTHGKRGGFFQVGTEAHADVAGGGLSPGPEQMLVFVHDEAKGSREECLHRGDVDLTVALTCMSIADFKERSFRMNRNIKCRARDEFLVVHVSGMHPRRGTVEPAGRLRRSYAHASKEGMQRYLNAGREVCDPLVAVERNDL